VTALGTEFQVRVMGRDVVVTLLEGKVAVDVPGPSNTKARETLVAGQQVVYNVRKEIGKKREADLEVAKGWTYGDLVFKRWRLDDLVAEMNRYSPTKLVIQDSSLGELVVSGRFHAGDHQSLILALENDWPVRAGIASAGEIALYRR
jgi:transmembrane sensor